MHKEVLSKAQIELLPLLKRFSDNFGLAGGTAVALQIGHRHSIDYSEEVDYLEGFSVDDDSIKKFLINLSIR